MATVVKSKKDLQAIVEGVMGERLKALQEEMAAARAEDRAALEEMRRNLAEAPTTDYSRFTTRSGDNGRGRGSLKRGELTHQFFWSIGAALHSRKSWSPQPPSTFAIKEFGKDAPVVRVLMATEGSGTSVIPTPVSDEIIEFLREESAVRSFLPPFMDLASGQLTIPKMTAGATATYVAEGQPAPITEQDFGDIMLFARKMSAILLWSNDWIKRAVSGASEMSRSDLVSAFAERSDLAFIRGLGTSNTPRGLRWLAHADNILTAQASPDLTKVTEDLSRMKLALRRKKITLRRPGWMWNPQVTSYLSNLRDGNGNYTYRDEMNTKGTVDNIPFRDTLAIPDDLLKVDGSGTAVHTEIYLADFANVIVGETQTIQIDMSDTAAYETGDPAFPVKSAYSRDQTVIRALTEHDINVRHTGTVAVLVDATWGNAL